MLDRTIAPPVHMMGNLKLPIPKTLILDNGVHLHYIDGGSQDVNQLNIVWQGGINDNANMVAPKLAASLMCEGTAKMSGAEISESIDFHGALLKAMASPHFTTLSLIALNSMTEGILPVVEDIITCASYLEAPFEMFRQIEADDFELARSNVAVLAREAVSILSKGPEHPEAIPLTKERILSTTLAQVRDQYRRLITAQNCHAFLSGRISDEVLHRTTDLLAGLQSDKPSIALDVVPYQPLPPQRVDIDRPGAVQAAVVAEIPAPDRNHPDYVPLRIAVAALGGYFGSRLMKNIREDKGYTYGIGAYLLGSREGGTISIMAQADKAYVDPLIDELRIELSRLVDVPLSHDEILALRQYLSTSLMEFLDSPFAIMDYYRTIHTVGIPTGYFERQVEAVRGLNAEMVCEIARKYIDPAQLRIAVCK